MLGEVIKKLGSSSLYQGDARGVSELSTPAPLQLDSTIHECGDKFS